MKRLFWFFWVSCKLKRFSACFSYFRETNGNQLKKNSSDSSSSSSHSKVTQVRVNCLGLHSVTGTLWGQKRRRRSERAFEKKQKIFWTVPLAGPLRSSLEPICKNQHNYRFRIESRPKQKKKQKMRENERLKARNPRSPPVVRFASSIGQRHVTWVPSEGCPVNESNQKQGLTGTESIASPPCCDPQNPLHLLS